MVLFTLLVNTTSLLVLTFEWDSSGPLFLSWLPLADILFGPCSFGDPGVGDFEIGILLLILAPSNATAVVSPAGVVERYLIFSAHPCESKDRAQRTRWQLGRGCSDCREIAYNWNVASRGTSWRLSYLFWTQERANPYATSLREVPAVSFSTVMLQVVSTVLPSVTTVLEHRLSDVINVI